MSTRAWLAVIAALGLCASLLVVAAGDAGETVVTITDEVVQADVKRFGINLGKPSGSGAMKGLPAPFPPPPALPWPPTSFTR